MFCWNSPSILPLWIYFFLSSWTYLFLNSFLLTSIFWSFMISFIHCLFLGYKWHFFSFLPMPSNVLFYTEHWIEQYCFFSISWLDWMYPDFKFSPPYRKQVLKSLHFFQASSFCFCQKAEHSRKLECSLGVWVDKMEAIATFWNSPFYVSLIVSIFLFTFSADLEVPNFF